MENIFEKLDCQRAIIYLLQIVPSSEDRIRRYLEKCYDSAWITMPEEEKQWKAIEEISKLLEGKEDWKHTFRDIVRKRKLL